jgi:hypothetical protein
MNCPCDQFEFPPRLYIPAGLSHLPRQIASFPEFRRALLHDVSSSPSLQTWRGRQDDDFGIMLLEMWAYVCDVTAFYDGVYADECYVRTAVRRESIGQLVALLGYRPRPAVGASVELAAFAEGRRAVRLPAGTAFRSEAFDGHPPQVFELTSDTVIHPFSNRWELQPRRPTTFGPAALNQNFLLCTAGSVTAKKGDLVLVRAGASVYPKSIQEISNYNGVDGARYSKVEFDSTFMIRANTPVTGVTITRPSFTAALWPKTFDAHGAFSLHGVMVMVGSTASHPYAYLDAVYRFVRAEQDVVFSVKNTFAARRILATSQQSRIATLASNTKLKDASNNDVIVPVPAATTTVTMLTLDSDIESFRFPAGPFASADISDIAVHLGFITAGTVTVEALTALADDDPLQVPLPIEQPSDADSPGCFQLEDKNQTGKAVDASLDYSTGTLQLGQNAGWDPALTVPVRLFGNIISATRGERVQDELLGFGDASQPNQTFKLKKSPLTYLPAPTQGNDTGVASTLAVYVDNVLWKEVPSFFVPPISDRAKTGQDLRGSISTAPHAYIVRENDRGETSVIFGDGSQASRLPTGARVTARYRFGAGAAVPPAGGIHQIARPAKGLISVRNPVAAFGGADAEPADQLRRYAPRSALLLGRAVSLADLEAAVAATEGVRSVRAEWRWNLLRQAPVAQIFYIGDAALDEPITQRLRGLIEPDTPIDVTPATALPRTLAIQIGIDPDYLEATVLAQVRAVLMDPLNGLLAPERIGIGVALFRSQIYEFVCAVPGTATVTDLQLNNAAFTAWGITPGAGNYFDFEKGALLLNGKNQ